VNKKNNLSKEDEKLWQDYIKNPSDVHDKEASYLELKKQSRRFKFDLHGYNLNDANKKVGVLIQHCLKNKIRELLLITGKGIHSNVNKNIYTSKDFGKLKYSVPEFIKTHEELNKYIISIQDAEKKDGGEGAILIKFKNLKDKF
tara:strand:- start:298 stop:729 length:432 start_codon:yes stop_codon:yes gene_type:complete